MKQINNKYEANHFLKMFPDSFSGFNVLRRKWQQWHHSLVSGLWSTTQCQRSAELKISHWYFDQCLYPVKTSPSVKNILSKRFSEYFFYSQPFNEMFIVNGKSHCCNDTFTDVRFTSLLAKNILRRIQIILCC